MVMLSPKNSPSKVCRQAFVSSIAALTLSLHSKTTELESNWMHSTDTGWRRGTDGGLDGDL